MTQQGQVFALKRSDRNGETLWAYRYRVAGRDSRRVQRGGFISEQDAAAALDRELDPFGGKGGFREACRSRSSACKSNRCPRRRQARSAAFGGDLRLQGTLPEGHRFEATQALRQVLNRAVAGS